MARIVSARRLHGTMIERASIATKRRVPHSFAYFANEWAVRTDLAMKRR